MTKWIPVVLLCLGAVYACRDAITPFVPPPTPWPGDSTGTRLTYSPDRDRSPVWSSDSKRVYYIARRHTSLPAAPAVLVAMPAEGGPAEIAIVDRQAGTPTRWFAAGTPSADGSRIASVELRNTAVPFSCFSVCAIGPDNNLTTQPRLVSATLRVSASDGSGGPGSDVTTTITFPGRFFDTTRTPRTDSIGLQGTWILTSHPFQRRFARDSAAIFRPSWAPDGNRLVFSDGARLYIWNVGSSAPAPIAGTEDGIFPAWSPDGQWIAYTRPTRSPAIVTECNCLGPRGEIQEVEQRIIFADDSVGGALVVIRPDGTNQRVIGTGDAPAWTPDNKIVARIGNALARVNVDGTGLVPIPNSANAWEPSVSPDGTRVAFARRDAARNWDVWVIPLRQ